MEANYKVVGMECLPTDTHDQVEKLMVRHSEKLNLHTKQSVEVVLYCKVYNKTGSQKKYSIHARVIAAGFTDVHAEVVDWNPVNAVHDVLKALERQVDK
jgi:ribosome-associated translation inhibitor RaiA